MDNRQIIFIQSVQKVKIQDLSFAFLINEYIYQ